MRSSPAFVSGLLPLVALAANAVHADPALVVAHGTAPSEAAPADWIGYEWPAPSTHFPPQARTVPANRVGALLDAADRYPSAGYHGRAVGLYREALKYWTPESTLLAAEYLWMATEALSRGIVEAEAAQLNMTPGNLAQLRKVAGPPTLYRLAREEVVFSEDAEALDALGKASEGFEHGYMPIPDVRALAEPILDRAARKVRHALISVLDMPAADATALLDPDLDEPRGLIPPMRILRGKLQVNDEGDDARPARGPGAHGRQLGYACPGCDRVHRGGRCRPTDRIAVTERHPRRAIVATNRERDQRELPPNPAIR